MEKGKTIFAFILLVSSVGAYRSNEAIMAAIRSREEVEGDGGAMLEKNVVEQDTMLSAGTRDFCASARCNDYTDEDDSSKEQLKFRFPDKGLGIDPMGRAEVAAERRYKGYHHGLLTGCTPVKNVFSYSRDWATHMQSNMRQDIWPKQPGNEYTCAERCKLKIFNKEGEQLNNGTESDVWVERQGHARDWVLSVFGVSGWSPAKCVVGNALQAHWWKQEFEYSKAGDHLMVDPEGLPVFPFAFSDILLKEFTRKFCALTTEQKISVTMRVTNHRPKKSSYGSNFSEVMLALKAQNYFPSGFPRQCDDGWDALNAEGVIKA